MECLKRTGCGRKKTAMTSAMKFISLLVLLSLLSFSNAKPLNELFDALIKKQNEIKNQQMLDFIRRSVPQGIDPPNPKIAEYETFKSDKTANFISDGHGSVVFRQFRRLRLADVFQRRSRGSGI